MRMKKLMISSLAVAVLLLGCGLYLGQSRNLNASSTLSIEEMGKIEAGGWCWYGYKCDGSGSCGSGTSCVPIGGGGEKCTVRNGATYKKCKGHFFTCGSCSNSSTTTCGTVTLYDSEGHVVGSWSLTHSSC